MSSPIAKADKTGFDKALIATHQQLSHSHRIDCLVSVLGKRIKSLNLSKPIRVLDVGCGDLTLSRGLLDQVEGIDLTCIDIHPPPLTSEGLDPIWQCYQQFDGSSLPFDEHAFDVVMFSDVLHHVPAGLVSPLLKSAARVGRFVLIKDHFEYGWFSRNMLRAMDFVGNYGYGVSVPKRYFSYDSFAATMLAAGLRIDDMDIGINLYDHLPFIRSVLSSKWQFVATCSLA
ncbi:MAG: class I SAM-dependent methyltransferase [Cyanobium sp.]